MLHSVMLLNASRQIKVCTQQPNSNLLQNPFGISTFCRLPSSILFHNTFQHIAGSQEHNQNARHRLHSVPEATICAHSFITHTENVALQLLLQTAQDPALLKR
jgi:hypothetical protein